MRISPVKRTALILCLCFCFLFAACGTADPGDLPPGPVTEKIPEEEMLQAFMQESDRDDDGPDRLESVSGADTEDAAETADKEEADGTENAEEALTEESADDAADPDKTETVSAENDPPVQSVFIAGPGDAHGYYYQFLDTAEAAAYDCMLQACGSLSTRADFTVPLRDAGLYNALDALRYDHPEYYWIRSSSKAYGYESGDIVSMEFSVPPDAGRILQQILSAAEGAAASAAGMSERDKVRYLYSWIIANTEYGSTDGNREQTAVGVLLDHRAVCAGYADAFQLLCRKAGISCITVVGDALNEDGSLRGKHAWNQIVVGGRHYWTDVTWGDPQFGTERHWEPGWINYGPLCAADDPFLKNHVIDGSLGRGTGSGHFNASYAACGDSSMEEYVLTGRIFGTLQDAAGYISACLMSGDPFFTFQMTSDPVFAETYAWLFEGGGMQQILEGAAVPYTEYQCFSDSVFRTIWLEFR